jgi:hypothetical protein
LLRRAIAAIHIIFVIALWRGEAAESAAREVLGIDSGKSQQSRLELGLRFNCGF